MLTAALCALLVTGGVTAAYAQDDTGTFVSGTKINHVGVAAMTPAEAEERIESFYIGSYTLTIHGRDGAETSLSGPEIGYRVEVAGGLEEILQGQNEGGRVSGPSVDNRYQVPMTAVYDETALKERLAALPLVTGASPTADASIAPWDEETGFVILPETQGNELDGERLEQAVKQALADGASSLDLESAGCYIEIQVRADDPALNAKKDAMNRSASMSLTYTFGERQEVLEGAVIASWLKPGTGAEMEVDREAAAAFVKTLAETYDTAGTARVFHTTRGTDVTLTGPYGWTIDQAAETDSLLAAIRAGESGSREPVYTSQAASHDGNDYGTTYVEVDIAGQHVYFYKDGGLVWDAPCVTGNLAKNYGTPDGIYGLYYKQKDKVLRGAKQADGSYEYESPVDYWMPFNGGIGLHDANWRSKFGGTIYETNGSHGCVNLPPSQVKELYDYLYKNVPVICHS